MPTAPKATETASRVVVIGAGAAGMMAAAEAALRGAEVHLLEKNSKTGVKILMSGGTRCNITQDTDARGIAEAFGRSGRFLQKSVGAFGPTDVVRLFNECGVATKVESTGKVFPQSDRALHVRDALQNRMLAAGVQLQLRSPVSNIEKRESGWSVSTEFDEIRCDKLIVTSGGKSWPGCGTTGDAYAWLHQLGHTIVRTRPALVPLVGGFAWTHALSGLTLDDCVASVFSSRDWEQRSPSKRKPLVSRRSSWLFTHHGFSGPAAMDVSGSMTAAETMKDVTLCVDLAPDLPIAELETELGNQSRNGKRRTTSLLAQWVPNRLAESIIQHFAADYSLAELPKQKRAEIVTALKQLVLPIQGTRGFAKAEVTAGGVKLSEVDPRTMASRLVDDLYIAGEVLDLDGWIGGYNFQSAFSTGRAAGIAATTSI